ncbi:MAG: class I SAM-dependent methyltransferase [Fusicatenibacter sp.]|nr:class I SAM-dependent methyltransferase [Fusicatenibacter sp.]
MPNINWNAADYKKDFSFVPAYGEALIHLITKQPGSTVVDLGCGNGTLTEKLADRGYLVTGVDDSDTMLQLARKEHPAYPFLKGNAIDFDLEEKADVIFSNAVFHWIDQRDQQTMLCNIFRNLKPGGELVCEFGGFGCAEAVHGTLEQCFAERGLKYPRTFYFPTIGQYAPMLEKAGFTVELAVLFDRPTPQNGPDGLANWIHMFIKKPFEGMEDVQKEDIISDAVSRLKNRLYREPLWIVDYVRIQFRAVKKNLH